MATPQQPQNELVGQFIEVIQALKQSSFSKEDLRTLIQEMKKPHVDEVALAREKREAAKTKKDMERIRDLRERAQAACSHKYKKSGIWAISPVHNFPDRQTRGHCNLCHLDIQPRHWEVAYDPANPSGKPILVEAHPLYNVVIEIEAETSWQLVS